MQILLSNDDGIQSAGIQAMYHALTAAGHTVHVYAPTEERSGSSSSLTVFSPMRAHPIAVGAFKGTAVTGTPADCVKFGLSQCTDIDLVISGINRGSNIGVDIFYSGTMGAAIEAVLNGVPALALSYRAYIAPDFSAQAAHAAEIAGKINWKQLAPQTLINVNYPAGALADSKGMRVCRHSTRMWPCAYEERKDPMGQNYWWLTGIMQPDTSEADCDCLLLGQGYVTLTPIHVDLNADALIPLLEAQIKA